MKILVQLKKNRRYFKRRNLRMTELVRICRQLASERKQRNVDVFLSPAKQTACISAVHRYIKRIEPKVKFVRLENNSDNKARPSPFGFSWDRWQVDKSLIINFVTHKHLSSIGGGIVYLLDVSDIYKDALRDGNYESYVLNTPMRHAAIGCVKSFLAR